MKKLLLILLSTIMAFTVCSRRPSVKINPELKARSMAEKLMLDDKMSSEFVPLYIEYMNAVMLCRTHSDRTELHTDDEIAGYMNNQFASRQKRLEVERIFYKRFCKLLTMRQVLTLFESPDWDYCKP